MKTMFGQLLKKDKANSGLSNRMCGGFPPAGAHEPQGREQYDSPINQFVAPCHCKRDVIEVHKVPGIYQIE